MVASIVVLSSPLLHLQLFCHNYHGGNNTQSSVCTTPDDNINSEQGELVALSSSLPRGTSSTADMAAAYAQYCGHTAAQFRQGERLLQDFSSFERTYDKLPQESTRANAPIFNPGHSR